nr:hypothetical protein [Tanacetum cinerariifolium]
MMSKLFPLAKATGEHISRYISLLKYISSKVSEAFKDMIEHEMHFISNLMDEGLSHEGFWMGTKSTISPIEGVVVDLYFLVASPQGCLIRGTFLGGFLVEEEALEAIFGGKIRREELGNDEVLKIGWVDDSIFMKEASFEVLKDGSIGLRETWGLMMFGNVEDSVLVISMNSFCHFEPKRIIPTK